ncbi:MAG: hypothetical protein ACPIOQ_36975 [Promethearchaeia archaeon]
MSWSGSGHRIGNSFFGSDALGNGRRGLSGFCLSSFLAILAPLGQTAAAGVSATVLRVQREPPVARQVTELRWQQCRSV